MVCRMMTEGITRDGTGSVANRERSSPTDSVALPDGYGQLLADLKERIRDARTRASVSVNRELVLLYWEIGQCILERQREEGWGARVIDHLARDLRRSFPGTRGFSSRNLKYMRALAEAYPDKEFVQGVLAQISWYHNITILEKVKEPTEREWYIKAAIEHGWSRAVLVHQVESGLYQRQGRAVTNFERTLPPPRSDLARELVKDPYAFDFLTLAGDARERELERGLIEHLRDFLLELGAGFALVGSQYRLDVGGQEYVLDLLFYHLHLRCFVVIDLKAGAFKPEHAGKMGFYLSAVDDLIRQPDDGPTIGIILCRERNRIVAEYALRELKRPMGVATYRLTRALPRGLRGHLPTVKELEKGLGGEG